jgi:pyruvate dehydrogenase E1 component
MPAGIEDGILKGIYRYATSAKQPSDKKVNLLGSGTILNEAIEAKAILEDRYDVSADVYSVTSYKSLYWDALDAERWNLLNPGGKPRVPYIEQALAGQQGVFIAASDYMQTLPASISKWVPGRFEYLGTEGFGRSDSREALRDFFEVDARYIALAGLTALSNEGKLEPSVVKKAIADLNIDPAKKNPLVD